MSLVTPIPQQTIIKLYRGIQWDNSYKDVRLFDTVGQREEYLLPKIIGQWNSCSIVDIGKSIKVEGNINNFLDADYMTFINAGMGDVQRTFFCFVTAVDYVNVNTVKITYEIDWIQTYLFQFEFKTCIVEREHVNDDTVGRHTLDENLDLGGYTVRMVKEENVDTAIYVYHVPDSVDSAMINNVLSGCSVSIFSPSNLAGLRSLLESYAGNPERVVMIVMGVDGMRNDGRFEDILSGNRETSFKFNDDIYVPKNNKMLCYPYQLLTLDNHNGGTQQYRFEWFEDPSFWQINVEGALNPKPGLQAFPVAYQGGEATTASTNQIDWLKLQFEEFPVCSWSNNAYEAWVSNFGSTYLASQAAQVIGRTASLISSSGQLLGKNVNFLQGGLSIGGNLVNAAVDTFQQGLDIRDTVKTHELHGMNVHASPSGSALNFAYARIGFRVIQFAILPQYARRIDNFFTRYGYRIDEVKVPNIRGRQVLNYVKTQGATVEGNIPMIAKEIMQNALNTGVTFWHNDNIGGTITSNPII